MNTQQSYQNVASNPTPFEQPASPVAKSTTMSDNRQSSLVANGITLNPEIQQAQVEILDLVDNFLGCVSASIHIQGITDLLYRWITMLDTNFDLQPNRDQLHTAFQLTNFLMELNERMLRLKSAINQAEKGGVTNG